MRVVRLAFAAKFQREPLADIHAAAKCNAPVHHEDLAVGAQIGIGQPQPHDDIAVEDIADDALFPERRQDARHGITRAHRIHQHTHLHAAKLRPFERRDKTGADPVIVENICFENDRPLRLPDRLQHGGIGRVSGHKRLDTIACRQRMARHPVAQRLHSLETPSEARGDHVPARIQTRHAIHDLVQHEGPLLRDIGPADAVDAGNRIDDRTDDGRQNDNTDPAKRGADLLLRHRGMHGRHGSHQNRENGKDMRPIGNDEIKHGTTIEYFGNPAMTRRKRWQRQRT
ncbi:hypothetical protein D3C78_942830 [compost metagenome]